MKGIFQISSCIVVNGLVLTNYNLCTKFVVFVSYQSLIFFSNFLLKKFNIYPRTVFRHFLSTMSCVNESNILVIHPPPILSKENSKN